MKHKNETSFYDIFLQDYMNKNWYELNEIYLTIYGRHYRIVFKKDKSIRKVVKIWEIRIRKRHRKRKAALLLQQQHQVQQRKNSNVKIPSLMKKREFLRKAATEC